MFYAVSVLKTETHKTVIKYESLVNKQGGGVLLENGEGEEVWNN